jgi:hypothetical protein
MIVKKRVLNVKIIFHLYKQIRLKRQQLNRVKKMVKNRLNQLIIQNLINQVKL